MVSLLFFGHEKKKSATAVAPPWTADMPRSTPMALILAIVYLVTVRKLTVAETPDALVAMGYPRRERSSIFRILQKHLLKQPVTRRRCFSPCKPPLLPSQEKTRSAN